MFSHTDLTCRNISRQKGTATHLHGSQEATLQRTPEGGTVGIYTFSILWAFKYYLPWEFGIHFLNGALCIHYLFMIHILN